MNDVIRSLLMVGNPKATNLNEVVSKGYRQGLELLGKIVSDEFFDIPKFSDSKEAADIVYTIPYFDDKRLWYKSKQWVLLAVFKLKNGEYALCMHIEFRCRDESNYSLVVCDDMGDYVNEYTLIRVENGRCFTQIPSFKNMTLHRLLLCKKIKYNCMV